MELRFCVGGFVTVCVRSLLFVLGLAFEGAVVAE